MIDYVKHREGVGLRPVGDSLCWQTWRKPGAVSHWPGHSYPTEGCHGAPLERECPTCEGLGLTDYDFWAGYSPNCGTCAGRGRVRLDAPNRRDVP